MGLYIEVFSLAGFNMDFFFTAIALIQSCLSKDVHSRPYIKDIRTRRKVSKTSR